MLEPSRQALSQYRLSKAEGCYIAAKCLLDDGLYTDSANRSYYAIFHAVRALLALEGVDFKKHSGVISHFQQHYIKTGMFDREYSDVVRDAFSIRQNCDYEDFFIISREDVVQQLADARRFLDTVTTYLTSQK